MGTIESALNQNEHKAKMSTQGSVPKSHFVLRTRIELFDILHFYY